MLYYTNQCPHTEKYAPLVKEIADQKGVPMKLIKIETTYAAQMAPSPCTSYSLFDHGEFVTNEILSEKKFLGYLDSKRKNI